MNESVQATFAEATAAANAGDSAKARELFERVIEQLQAKDDAGPRAVALSTLATLLLRDGEPDRAIELWERVLPLVDATGDVRGRSLTLDKLGSACAAQNDWRRALAFWEQGLELDSALGTTRDRAAALANVALAAARVGDGRRAQECWREAVDTFAKLGVTAQLSQILLAMASSASETEDYSDPLGVRQRVLELVAGKDPHAEALALDGLARAATTENDDALSLRYSERAHAGLRILGRRTQLPPPAGDHELTSELDDAGDFLALLGHELAHSQPQRTYTA